MTDETSDTFAADADRVREEAAGWVARLAGHPSPASRRELDAWLAADPRHAAAYHRQTQRFDDARILRTSRRYAARPRRVRHRSRIVTTAAALAAAAAIVILLLPYRHWLSPRVSDQPTTVVMASGVQPFARHLGGAVGTVRAIGLQDGSVVTLDGAGVADIAYTLTERRIALVRGRARFFVVHDGRPFIVVAGGKTITARGTEFDVVLSSAGRVKVTLLRGIVDVGPAALSPAISNSTMRRLTAGQMIDYAAADPVDPNPTEAPADQQQWADRAVDFDDVSLSYLLDQANPLATRPIRLAEPELGALRVSGRFDIDDTARLSQNLAQLFDLHIDSRHEAIVLRRS